MCTVLKIGPAEPRQTIMRGGARFVHMANHLLVAEVLAIRRQQAADSAQWRRTSREPWQAP